MNKTKLGGALSALGIAIFGIPASMVAGGITSIPKGLTVGCMLAGLLVAAAGHFCTSVFAAATDGQQQKQLDSLKQQVDENTDYVTRTMNAKLQPGTAPPAAKPPNQS